MQQSKYYVFYNRDTLIQLSLLWQSCTLISVSILKSLLRTIVSQIRYLLVVILELNGVSEVQYKDVMMVDNGKYQ